MPAGLVRVLFVSTGLITALAAPPAWGSTRIAVLGLEGKGVSTDVVHRFSRAIIQPVARAPGYRLVPGMALDEVKLVFGCVRERPRCMARVGKNLQVANLLWGSVRGSGKRYTVTLKLLDVSSQRVSAVKRAKFSGLDALNPVAGASRLVRTLLGGSVGSLQVLHATANPADVLVDGHLVGRTENGRLLVNDLAPGPHALALHSDGHTSRRQVTVTAGTTTDVHVDLIGTGAIPVGAAADSKGASTAGWQVAFWTTAALALGTGVALIPNGLKVSSLEKDKQAEIKRLTGPDSGLSDAEKAEVSANGCAAPAYPSTGDLRSICDSGKSHAIWQNVLIGVTAGLAVLSGVFAYKAFFSRNTEETDRDASTDGRTALQWQLLPAISPQGAQMGFRLRF